MLSISLSLVRRVGRGWIQAAGTVRKSCSKLEIRRRNTMKLVILMKAGKNTETGF